MKEGWCCGKLMAARCVERLLFLSLLILCAAAVGQRKAEQPSVLLPPLDFPGTSFSVISYLCNAIYSAHIQISCISPGYKSNIILLHILIALLLMKCSRAGLIHAVLNVVSLPSAYVCPALNGSFMLPFVECSNAIKIRSGIMLNFYPGLPHRFV